MAVREIIFANDPRLHQKAKRVKQFGPALKALADDMLETMHEAHGVGLAAPQIGLLQRLFVAYLPEDEEDPQSGKPYVLVNPEVVKASRSQVEGEEGCLSIPTWYGLVSRPEWVLVKARDTSGKPVRIKAEGFLARVFLHEMDTWRVSSLWIGWTTLISCGRQSPKVCDRASNKSKRDRKPG